MVLAPRWKSFWVIYLCAYIGICEFVCVYIYHIYTSFFILFYWSIHLFWWQYHTVLIHCFFSLIFACHISYLNLSYIRLFFFLSSFLCICEASSESGLIERKVCIIESASTSINHIKQLVFYIKSEGLWWKNSIKKNSHLFPTAFHLVCLSYPIEFQWYYRDSISEMSNYRAHSLNQFPMKHLPQGGQSRATDEIYWTA